MKTKVLFLFFSFVVLSAGAFAQTGSIKGRVSGAGSVGALAGATIRVNGTTLGTTSNTNGEFMLTNVPVGKRTISASFVGYTSVEKTVDITAGGTIALDFSLEESGLMADDVVVTASRRPEKLTEAPATISVISARDLEMTAGFNPGELASKLQGVEFVRTGVNGVGINARGFNNAFNAKILAMTDGRNSMMAGGSGLPVGIMNTVIKEDIERVEVVLGPNSALYGPNAHNGIVNTITKDPRRYQGTTVAVGGGNQSVISARLRHAQVLSDKFAFKVTGEYTTGQDFEFRDSVYVGGTFVAGVGNLYGAVRPVPEKIKTFNFKHIRGEAALYYSLKKGTDLIVSYGGSVNDFLAVNNVGRNQIDGWKFSYLQARYVSPKLYGTLYYTWTNVGDSYGITPYTRDFTNRTNSIITQGSALYPILGASFGRLSDADADVFAKRYGNKFKEASGRLNGEIQYNDTWENIGLSLVASVSYQQDYPNTFGTSLADSDKAGEQGANLIKITQLGGALQLEKKLGAGFKLVGGARLDNHSVFGNLFAPKVGIVKAVSGGSVRLTYGRAYAAPIILFQYANVFGLVFGNGNGVTYIPNGANTTDVAARKITEKLVPEEISTIEFGYKGLIGKKLYFDMNAYYNQSQNFLSPAITVGGRALSVGDIVIPTQNLLLGGTVATNGTLSGAAFSTYFNYGEVASWGADFGLNYFLTPSVVLGAKYSYFNSDITNDNIKNDANRDGYVSLEERSLNAAKNRFSSTLSFTNLAKGKAFANLSLRWVEAFDFYSGNQIGTAAGQGKRGVVLGPTLANGSRVSYLKNYDWGPLGGFTTIDISGGYRFSKVFSVGTSISNLFNTKQREFVGSPLIGRLFTLELKATIPHKK
jgi:outer membrane receptor for ferrienterochelin and colicins